SAMLGQTLEQGRAIARTVEATAPYYVIFGLTSDLTNIVRDLKRNPSIEYADFVDADGNPLARSTAVAPFALTTSGRPLAATDGVDLGDGSHLFIVPFRDNADA